MFWLQFIRDETNFVIIFNFGAPVGASIGAHAHFAF